MCHVLNEVRQEVYGMQVAKMQLKPYERMLRTSQHLHGICHSLEVEETNVTKVTYIPRPYVGMHVVETGG